MTTQTNDCAEAHPSSADQMKSQRVRRIAPETARHVNAPCRTGAEYYDTLLWRIQSRREAADNAGFLLGLTSCDSQAGVSTVAANLAIRVAELGLGPALLADFNFRNPSLHRLLRAKRTFGLTELLLGQATFDDYVQSTSVPGLQFLPLGIAKYENRVRVTPDQVSVLNAELRERYALVVFDLPDAQHLGPALPFASKLDAALLVVRSGRASKHTAQQAIRSLFSDSVPLIGSVLTGQSRDLPRWVEMFT